MYVSPATPASGAGAVVLLFGMSWGFVGIARPRGGVFWGGFWGPGVVGKWWESGRVVVGLATPSGGG